MVRRGRRAFSAASLGLLLVAILHTLGNLSTTPANEAEAAVLKAMSGYTLPMGIGMAPSFWDIFRSLSFTMSITLLVWGVQNLLAAKHGSDRLIKLLTVLSTIGVGALVVLYGVYRVPPPLITLGVVELIFLAALLFKGSESEV
jgi:hypothetical protein